MKNIFNPLLYILFSVVLLSCDDSDPITDTTVIDNLKISVQATYPEIVYANYKDAYDAAIVLDDAIDAFLTEPTEAGFTAAKQAWLAAREPYGQSEAFRFANGPIDAEDGPEGALNAWPLDENYIDYVEGATDAGIINNPNEFPTISADILEAQNELGGEANISIGYHAIEFLLWGQDLTAPADKISGQRPYTDFVTDGSGTAINQDRRSQYLKACSDLLLNHLKSMVDAWDPAVTGNYRATFLALPVEEALTNMLTSIGVLGKSELAGERIFTAYDNQNQEDEHSCFSDNTHRDVRLNALGIQNVYMATYNKTAGSIVTGASLHNLIQEVDEDLAAEVLAQVDKAIEAVDATADPFDFAISDETTRPVVLTAVNELQTMGDKFAEVGSALGLTINTGLPE